MSQWLPLVAIVALFFAFRFYMSRGRISSAQAHELVSHGALLVDVRTPGEYASGHLDGAINVPLGELSSQIDRLGKKKDRPVVLYCASGMRSASAKRMLQGAGFTAVNNLGPMSAW